MMNTDILLKNLESPKSGVDMIRDTDAFNEIDDQFAIAYMMRNTEKLNVRAIYAAPFHNSKSTGPEDGMEKSYDEIIRLLSLLGRGDMNGQVYKGAGNFLEDEQSPVASPAAKHLAEFAMNYTCEKPLYVAAIGAITNIASAILINPQIIDRIVIVWLGGHSFHWQDTKEFNLFQDVAAARVIFGCGAPVVQLPCGGVVSAFTISGAEMEKWLLGKNELCDYLVRNSFEEVASYASQQPWTRVIWDVTAVAWLVNSGFFEERIEKSPIPGYDGFYSFDANRHPMKYVYNVRRDELVRDLFSKLARTEGL